MAIETIWGIENVTGEPTGFETRTTSTIDVATGEGATTSTFTIAPTDGTFSVWVHGQRFVKTAESVTIPHTTGSHYIYYTTAGTLTRSPTAWAFDEHAPVALIYWSTTANSHILMDERHGATMDWASHKYLHQTQGTRYLSGLTISGYTVTPQSPTDDHNTFEIAAGQIADEDLIHTLPAFTAGERYPVLYRTGATEWTWMTSTVPLLIGTSYVAYNTATNGNYALAEGDNSRFINYWLFAAPSENGFNHFLVAGQVLYQSLATAQAASAASLNLGAFPFAEALARYKITYGLGSSYTTTGKARIASVEQLLGTSISVIGSITPSNHTSLAGRTEADQHPASSITNTPAGALVATNVQDALNALDTRLSALEP